MIDEALTDNSPSEPLYSAGDIVRHRASGQVAVVLHAVTITVHDRLCRYAQLFPAIVPMPPCGCASVFSDEYAVSTGFDTDEIFVDECELKADVPTDHSVNQ